MAPSIHNGAVLCNGEAIELSMENSRRVAAVGAAGFAKPAQLIPMPQWLSQLNKRCARIVAEFEEISEQEQHGDYWLRFTEILMRGSAALRRIESKTGSPDRGQKTYFSPAWISRMVLAELITPNVLGASTFADGGSQFG